MTAVSISVIVPVHNAMKYLPTVVPAIVAAGTAQGGVEYIFIDNGSSDGSREYLQQQPTLQVLSSPGVSVSALRNQGASLARGGFLSFIDADCVIEPGYFRLALDDLAASGAAATGCEYALPQRPGWIESAWTKLHDRSRSEFVNYLNAGNFFIRKEAFDSVGGFRNELWTGEDAELGQRLVSAGHRIHRNPEVRAVHLGNPKSLRHFFRQQAWHGLGMFGTVNARQLDKPTAMMFAQLAFTIGAAVMMFSSLGLAAKIITLVASQAIVPLGTVLFRLSRSGRWSVLLPGVLLYFFYYWARLRALALLVRGQAPHYRK